MLGILYQVYQKRENQYYADRCINIATQSLEDCNDRNIFMIFQLKNLNNKLSKDEVEELLKSDQKDQFFDYLSQQIIFIQAMNLASLCVENIRRGNPIFSEDIEIYLNYIRVFNNEFGEKFSLNLPSISTQIYFHNYPGMSVDEATLSQFREIYEEKQRGNFEPLFKMLAESIAVDSYKNFTEELEEISKQNFIESIRQEINGIALDFLLDLETLSHKEDEAADDYINIKKIVSHDLKQLQISTLKDIIFEQLMAIKENREFITSLTQDKIKEITESFKKKYLASLETNGDERTTDLLTENSSAIESRPSSPRNTEIAGGATSSSRSASSR